MSPAADAPMARRSLWQRIVRHLRDRTLPDRLSWKIAQYKQARRKAWWESHRGEAISVVDEIQPGVRMDLPLDSELARLLYCGHFESAEREFMNRFLRTGDTFVDVGANIGLFSLIAAKRVGPSGRVVAYEPTPVTHSRLVRNVELNGFVNVSCRPVALSDAAGDIEMVESRDGFDAWNSLAQPTMGGSFNRESIRATTLDDEMASLLGSTAPTMVKIDVEGWEERVIAGGHALLSRPDAPLLQVEFADASAAAAGGSCQRLYALLERLGYRLHAYDLDRGQLVHDPLRGAYPYANLFATKNVQWANARLEPR